MPRYDFACECGVVTEALAGYETDALLCQRCGALAHRVAIYTDQYTRTESGGMQGRMGKAGKLSEDAERMARHSDTIRKETGRKSGLGLR